MDQPAAKKRRLAPKIEAQASPPHPPAYAHEPAQPAQHFQAQEAPPPPPERHEFESFARHLQDAAMLIYRQTQKSPYTKASVLLLSWSEDNSVEEDLVGLDQVLRDRFNYRTERFAIPATATASTKLGIRMASFLERAGPDHLLIIYYAGYAYAGADNQLFWASNERDDAAKLRWAGFRCLFEEAASDVLLLLDTCASKEQIVPGGGSVKQVIAASTPEHHSRDPGLRSFTSHVIDALTKLSAGRPFTVEQLYHDIVVQKQHELTQASGLTNGASKSLPFSEKIPVFYTLSSGKGQGLSLSPLPSDTETQSRSPRASVDADAQLLKASREDPILHPSAIADLTFDEPRVLVCTTFVGEASPDMSSFNHWLHNAPAIASKIAVEGMFLGPPTMLLISMPVAVWNVVQHDKVCCFLGYVNSHNMTHLYNRLVGSVSVNKASAKDVEDGRMLLEAREMAVHTPIARRHELPNHAPLRPETPIRPESMGRLDPVSLAQSSVASNVSYTNSTPGAAVASKNDVEDSAEMQEAAEQLKALSHVRHLSGDTTPGAHAQPTPADDIEPSRHEEVSAHDANESGADATQYHPEFPTPSRPKQPRRSLQKQTPKQETRCNMCSHAPFKDSSSLRKHIAAAHTRPFPCAFAFAGCTSTFGSKNEWKRHIASQHLCLQYYRCSSCPHTAAEGKGNEFNRKDLFTQHLRRMHAPFAIKKAIVKGDSKLQVDWENHVKEMQQSCLVTRRKPPQRSSCPKQDCGNFFEGPTSWDEWTEHVGRHMEKGEASRLGVDRLLAKWAVDEGIIERRDDGDYRLCSGAGGASADREPPAAGSVECQPDERDGARPRDPNDRTIIAASTMVDKMDVDE
ncbi:hypothetical protein GGS23DRAFT_158421 [Durotheca rogersii]|uniref:uncharacterized protein n=1 Tax=Durotheca rogersii TaxID=419775 RepID=UPI00221ED3D1|nr:uncharacterized protein GGS23DRAFT_158421 [Durotheca rogersii]KAI5861215.1 hypothetical protein GGS23DRAFT_158421 [Durotheca rogersii]